MSATNEMVNRLLGENKITLAEAGRLVGTDGAPVHQSTVNRFVHRGARAADGRRVRLEAFRVGAKWLTTREAVARFLAALTAVPGGEPAAPKAEAPVRNRAANRAGAQLVALGA